MIRFEFHTPKEKWVGEHHYRAWRDRMKQVAANFESKEGINVFYSFEAENIDAAEALTELVFGETKAAVHQSGPKPVSF